MFRTTFTFRIARYSFRTKAIHTSFDTKFVSAQFALKFVNAQCVYVNLAGCADWQIGNSDPALLILLTLNLTSRIKNEMIPAIIPMNIFGKYVNVHVKWTVNIILARLWNVAVAVVGFETGTGRAVTCYKPRPVIRSMYELTFTFRLADLVRHEVRSKQRSDHPLVIQCLVTERLVTERSHYKFSRITKRSMYDTYVRNDNVNALVEAQPRTIIKHFNYFGLKMNAQ